MGDAVVQVDREPPEPGRQLQGREIEDVDLASRVEAEKISLVRSAGRHCVLLWTRNAVRDLGEGEVGDGGGDAGAQAELHRDVLTELEDGATVVLHRRKQAEPKVTNLHGEALRRTVAERVDGR